VLAGCCLLLGAVTVLFASGAAVGRSRAHRAAVAVHGRAGAPGFAALPLAARGPVSAALGRDDSSFSARVLAGALTLSNRGQGLLARFGERGVQIRSGRARLGLRLVGYGYGSEMAAVGGVAPRAQANRVVYRHAGVSEWYANGPLGLEQGFTLSGAPARRAGGALTLALALSGNLYATLSPGAVTFSGANRALSYRGLVASDATGRRLAARIQLAGGRLLIRVDSAGGHFPLRIDPFIQQPKLTASDGAADDFLGASVAMSGDTIVAGAPDATVNGNSNQGAAYVFIEPTTGWASATQTAKLTASDGAGFDFLGASVAISGDTMVAGAPFATVNGNSFQGAAYVFIEPTTGWANGTQTAKLTASDGAANDLFGQSVATSGRTIVAGAPGATVNGNSSQGAAYVFGAAPLPAATVASPHSATLAASGGISPYHWSLSGGSLPPGAGPRRLHRRDLRDRDAGRRLRLHRPGHRLREPHRHQQHTAVGHRRQGVADDHAHLDGAESSCG